jgi:hypothetical protein
MDIVRLSHGCYVFIVLSIRVTFQAERAIASARMWPVQDAGAAISLLVTLDAKYFTSSH